MPPGSWRTMTECSKKLVNQVAVCSVSEGNAKVAAGMLRPDVDSSQIPPGMGMNEAQEETLDTVARRHGATRVQIALAWLLASSPSILMIAGTSKVAHLEENLGAGQIKLSGEDMVELDKLV